MAELRVCVKCKIPVIKNQRAFKQDDGSIIHGDCYNCDQCNQNMVGKRVGSVPGPNGKTYIKVCWDCMMKHPHYSILYGDQSGAASSATAAAPQKQAVDKIDVCKECGDKIIGKSYKTKAGDHYHDKCYLCDKCGSQLAGKKYGFLNQQKWCQGCINERANTTGDIATKPKKRYSAGKAYAATMTKLKNQDVRGMRNTTLGKERRCAKCGDKIAGPSITIEKESAKFEYHKKCLICDDCKGVLTSWNVRIFKDKQLCPNCITKYLDYGHGKPLPK